MNTTHPKGTEICTFWIQTNRSKVPSDQLNTFCMEMSCICTQHNQWRKEFVHFWVKPTDLKLPWISWWCLLQVNVLHTTLPKGTGSCAFWLKSTDLKFPQVNWKCLLHGNIMHTTCPKVIWICTCFFYTKTNRPKVSTGQLKMLFARKYHAHNTPKGECNLYLFKTEFVPFFTKTNRSKVPSDQRQVPVPGKSLLAQNTATWQDWNQQI